MIVGEFYCVGVGGIEPRITAKLYTGHVSDFCITCPVLNLRYFFVRALGIEPRTSILSG